MKKLQPIFPIILFSLLAMSCGEARVVQSTAYCASKSSPGTECGGGVIYLTNYQGTGDTLVAALEDETPSLWNIDGLATLNAQDVNDGRNNTGELGANFPAYMACEDSTMAGFNDWYLPALNELIEIWNNIALVPNLAAVEYWSSTEAATVTRAEEIDMLTGANGQSFKDTATFNVRCIRRLAPTAFTP